MPVISARSTDLAQRLDSVISAAESFLDDGADDPSPRLLAPVRDYFMASDVFAVDISGQILAEPDDDTDRFAPTGPRAMLCGAAISDLLVFRCIGVVDYWAAVIQSGAGAADADRNQFYEALQGVLREARDYNEGSMPAIAGGSVNDLTELTTATVRKIADESTSNVLSALPGTLSGIVPSGVSGAAVRALHRFGRALHLDDLLEWAQRMLDLALNKLHRVFGPGFDVVVEDIKTSIDKIVRVRERVADRLFQIPDLKRQCDAAIEDIARDEEEFQVDERQENINALYDKFDNWSTGLDIATASLKWGSRIAAVAPPVAVALAALRGALAAGAFLIGQYHLDSPEIEILPWKPAGVLCLLK